VIALCLFALAGAVVNGALGYGFASVAVPLALTVTSNRAFVPVIALLEVAMNLELLWVTRRVLPRIWRRTLCIVVGLAPGVWVGVWTLQRLDPAWLKLGTYAAILLLVLLQAAGYRRGVRAEQRAGLAFGAGIGLLYGVTAISGPAVAIGLANQGYVKDEFRAALGFVRIVEATLATALYARVGLYAAPTASLLMAIAPAVLLGVPVGAALVRRVPEAVFRRACIGFNATVAAFGASAILRALHVLDGPAAYAVGGAALALVAAAAARRPRAAAPEATCQTS
jgi:uncharacterized protein